ncbi:MAG: protein kinase [Myxococcota bacterium]
MPDDSPSEQELDEAERNGLAKLLAHVAEGDIPPPRSTLSAHEGLAEPDELCPGLRLGNFELDHRLGAGGFGVVWAAHNIAVPALKVAIKILLLSADEAEQRFVNGANALAGLRHPNIVRLLDVGRWNERPYMVMEHLEGMDLAQRLRDGPLRAHELLRLAEGLFDGLSALHPAVLHRDIKPANVFWSATPPYVKLLDFGLVKTEQKLTRTGAAPGTAAYMAPEHHAGYYDVRSEVYAVAVTLIEAATGRPPWTLDDDSADLLPLALREPLVRAWSSQAEERHATIAELREELMPALRRWAHGGPTRGRRFGPVLGAGALGALAATGVWLALPTAEPLSTEPPAVAEARVQPTPEPQGGWLTTISRASGRAEVWLVRDDGSARVRMTEGLTSDGISNEFSGAMVSPRKDTIAVMSDRTPDGDYDGIPRLHTFGLDGGGFETIADTLSNNEYRGLSWEPDGKGLLFSRGPGCAETLFRVEPERPFSQRRHFIQPEVVLMFPSINPRDGSVVALGSRCNGPGVNEGRIPPQPGLVNVDAGRFEPMPVFAPECCGRSAWDPQGEHLAVMVRSSIVVESTLHRPRFFESFDGQAPRLGDSPPSCTVIGPVTIEDEEQADEGVVGRVANFLDDGRLECGSPAWLTGLAAFTMTARFRIEVDDMSSRSYAHTMLMSKTDRAETDGAFQLRVAEMRPAFSMTTSTGPQTIRHPRGLERDRWYELAVTYDGAMLRMYVDGALTASTPVKGAMPGNDVPLVIGNGRRATCRRSGLDTDVCRQSFPGSIDEVRIYDEALSAEVLATTGRLVTPPGLTAMSYGADARTLFFTTGGEGPHEVMKLDVPTRSVHPTGIETEVVAEIDWFDGAAPVDEDGDGVADALPRR